MTWVIAQPTMFGYGVMISDIQVTIQNNGTVDCLQKIHRVSNHIVIGFAGSVAIGFGQVESLRQFLTPPPDKGTDWDPEWVVAKWSKEAKRVFDSSTIEQREGMCSLIIASPHPNEDVGIPGLARIYVYELHSPDFIPVRKTDGAASIGSGNGVTEYTKALQRAATNVELMKAEMAFSGGFGASIASSIGDILREHPVPGISKHVHIATIGRGRMTLQSNNYIIYDKAVEHIVMPPVAQTYEELVSLIGDRESAMARANSSTTLIRV